MSDTQQTCFCLVLFPPPSSLLFSTEELNVFDAPHTQSELYDQLMFSGNHTKQSQAYEMTLLCMCVKTTHFFFYSTHQIKPTVK